MWKLFSFIHKTPNIAAASTVSTPTQQHPILRKVQLYDIVLILRIEVIDYNDQGTCKSDSNMRKRLSVIIVASVIAGFLIVCLVCRCIRWKKKKNKRGMECKKEDIEVPFFDLETLTAASDGFSPENLVGAGHFGSVFKGCLCAGQDIAVKRLSKNSKQGLEEFKNEVVLIAKLQHRNRVRLLGCCIQGEERMLIKREVHYCLADQKRSALLPWKKRFGIIMGIAQGLLYLHQESRLQIIHRDLKTSNVLLDQNLNAVISDFGLARTFGGDEVQVRTNRVAGTYGYMSPEHAVDGEFLIKSGVFTFGVLILEILSSKKNKGFTHPDHHQNLLGYVSLQIRSGKKNMGFPHPDHHHNLPGQLPQAASDNLK
ncbi:Serine-threonine/tyrosine-protein kinase [Theobroma cacao]|nr:Serine-threonine/tyrosine-protein kinase [Theobroma cacao]